MQTVSSRRVHSYGYEFLGGHATRKQGRMWQNVYLMAAFIVSLSVSSVAAVLQTKKKSVAASGGKTICSKNVIFVGKERCAVHTQAFHCNQSVCNLNASVPTALLCLSSVFPICCIYPGYRVSFSPLVFWSGDVNQNQRFELD